MYYPIFFLCYYVIKQLRLTSYIIIIAAYTLHIMRSVRNRNTILEYNKYVYVKSLINELITMNLPGMSFILLILF